jgi:glutamate-1-semialdehyde 2,1-aminomutase
MDTMNLTLLWAAFGTTAVTLLVPSLKQRLELSKAKHPSLRGHSRMARRFAKMVPFYEYSESEFFVTDDPPEEIATRRKAGFARLAALFRRRFAKSAEATTEASEGISDIQFTSIYRNPFQYSHHVRSNLKAGSFMTASSGVLLTDLDGNRAYDLAGSYGVNVFGYDFYKKCIEEATKTAGTLGPVLGFYHPIVTSNVRRLKEISGLDEVSFHMSGTEAVMQAVRLARYHTKRTHLVRFCGAYHGWWGDVQPGIGNPQVARETYTLKDMDPDSLRVLRKRKDIACVLVNPLQALHPNSNAPSDGTLLSSDRRAHYDKEAYTKWLHELRRVCTERKIVLIMDEVFLGFRLAPGGAQQYFGIKADMVTYGKTLGGGLPVGVVCGRADLMKRYRFVRPADVCFARGTFNAHPYVMAAMDAFLRRIETPEIQTIYAEAETRWNNRCKALNAKLEERKIPVRLENMHSIFTVQFSTPCRYNWMLQHYMRAEGLALSWVGTGRFIFSLNYTDEDFEEVSKRFFAAIATMTEDGFFWSNPALNDKAIKRRVFREMLSHLG